ncbi:hypothetical protein ACFL0V_04255 [Nanoarchaeota archaeon]
MQFTTGPNYTPMEREYHEPSPTPKLQKPIIPISELGTTVPEKHPVTGGHLLQNIDANIRTGVKKMQIILTQPSTSPMGGRPKAYGKEARESIRELARVNDVEITGIEMPTSSMGNLSGYDTQQHQISENKRQMDIQEVKDAIKFVADIGGGGVDIWSQEYQRDMYDADWNKNGLFELHSEEQKFSSAYVVDTRTGRVHAIQKGQPIFEPIYKEAKEAGEGYATDGVTKVKIEEGDWLTVDGLKINPENEHDLLLRMPEWDQKNSEFRVNPLKWNDIKKKTTDYNKKHNTNLLPEEYAIRTQLDNQILQRKGQSLFYSRNYQERVDRLKALQKSLKYYEKIEDQIPEEEMWRLMETDPATRHVPYIEKGMKKPTEIIQGQIYDLQHDLKHVHEASSAADAQAKEIMEQKKSMESISRYAKKKSMEAYADLGIEAMNEQMNNKHVERDIHVGPEMGWPTAYGGHPDEFIELIKGARKKMAKKLQGLGYSKQRAAASAKKHIKGTWDTSHMGMWVNHFKKEPGETEEQKVARFKQWFLKMTDKMGNDEIIGGIQLVDSATGAHGHLPVGQGFLGKTIVDAVDLLKSKGWNGWMVSEGHEEEQFGQGRIITATWRAFGADIGTSFFDQPTSWNGVEGAYFGHGNPPPYIVGAYAPSEEYRGAPFWSGLPLD